MNRFFAVISIKKCYSNNKMSSRFPLVLYVLCMFIEFKLIKISI